jgi:hypothetical protein
LRCLVALFQKYFLPSEKWAFFLKKIWGKLLFKFSYRLEANSLLGKLFFRFACSDGDVREELPRENTYFWYSNRLPTSKKN